MTQAVCLLLMTLAVCLPMVSQAACLLMTTRAVCLAHSLHELLCGAVPRGDAASQREAQPLRCGLHRAQDGRALGRHRLLRMALVTHAFKCA